MSNIDNPARQVRTASAAGSAGDVVAAGDSLITFSITANDAGVYTLFITDGDGVAPADLAGPVPPIPPVSIAYTPVSGTLQVGLPEPGTGLLLSTALAALACLARIRRICRAPHFDSRLGAAAGDHGRRQQGSDLRNPRSFLAVVSWLGFACLLGGLAPPAAAGGCPRFVAGSQGLPTAWEWRTHPALGDVNEDGRLDIAAHPRKARGPQVWLGDGKGAWTRSSQGLLIPGMSCGVGVALADVNGDGHLDLGVADHCHGVFVFLGDGSGKWRLGEGAPLGEGGGHEDLQFGDLNGDGKLDLIAVGAFQGGFAVYFGNGKGGWQKGSLGLPELGYGRDVKLADANRDGVLDVFASFTADPASGLPPELRHNVVWLSAGQDGYHRASQGIPGDQQYRGVAVGDVDGDGELDLAVSAVPKRPGQRPLRVYRGDGGGHWKLASDGLPDPQRGLSFSGVGFTDLDGDGNQDLVALTWLDAAIRVWRGDGAGHWEECTETGLPAGRTEFRSSGLALRDLNGDGKPDLVAGFGRDGKGSLEVWLQR